MTDTHLPQTHWVNKTFPAAIPPGMEHAILILESGGVAVDTLASMLTKSAYPPSVEPIRPGETPATITATGDQMELAARYERNLREIGDWTDFASH